MLCEKIIKLLPFLLKVLSFKRTCRSWSIVSFGAYPGRNHGPQDAGIALDVPPAEQDLIIDMTKSLGIRGCMHMVNKLQEVVLKHLTEWDSECKAFLTSLCIYFNNGELRKEFCVEGLLKRGGIWQPDPSKSPKVSMDTLNAGARFPGERDERSG